MRIAITGGAGFMGSNMVRYILTHYPDYEVLNIDKLTYAGNLENLTDVRKNPHYRFVQADITDEKAIDVLFAEWKPTIVLNYAAETHVDRSILDPKAFLLTDIVGTYTLLEAVRKHGVQRMVQISTDEVFGSIQEGQFTEESPFQPNSPYAAAKAGGDHLCRAYWITYQTPVIVTHSCNFYGPYQYPEKFIPLAITNLLEGKTVPVYGTGENVREWIYTEDHCRAVDRIAHDGVPGEVYNIATANELRNIEVVKQLLHSMNLPEDRIEFVKDRPGHDWRYSTDASKLQHELGWTPEVSFEEGIARTVEWYSTHREWWQPLKSGAFAEYYKQQYERRAAS